MVFILKCQLFFIFLFFPVDYVISDIFDQKSSAPLKPGDYTWVQIVLGEVSTDPPYYKKVIGEHKKICGDIMIKADNRGFRTAHDISQLCKFACLSDVDPSFRSCKRGKSSDSDSYTRTVMDWSVNGKEFEVPDDVLDTWKILIPRLWPLLLPVGPAILQQMKQYRWPHAMTLITLYIVIMIFVDVTFAQKIHTLTACGVGLLSAGPTGIVPEVVGGALILIVFVCVCFMRDLFFQLATALVIVIIYVAWLGQTFVQKRQGSIGSLLVMASMLMVMLEQIWMLHIEYKLHNFNMDVMEMMLNSIIPNGESWYWGKNVCSLSNGASKRLALMTPWAAKYQEQLFLVFILLQFVCAFLFRSFFGIYVLLTMRYKFSAEHFITGFIVAVSDLPGGAYTFIRMAFLIEKYDSRKFCYALVNLIFVISECFYAWDLLLLRVIAYFLDEFIFQTRYNSQPKFLKYDMNYADFPQEGQMSWLGMDRLNDLSQFVVRLKVKSSRDNYVGVGFLKDCGSHTQLLSVNHVLKFAKRIVFRDHDLRPTRAMQYDEQGDPTLAIKLDTSVPGAKVEFLTRPFLKDVKNLFLIRLGDNDEPCVTYMNKYDFGSNGEIRVSAGLSFGDSGAPVFAIMKDNGVYYAGCVSAGNADRFSGNHISGVYNWNKRAKTVQIGIDHPELTPVVDICDALPKAESQSSDSETGKHVTFNVFSEDLDDCETRLVELESKIDLFVKKRDRKTAGGWFIDVGDDGNEVTRFDKNKDIVGFAKEKFGIEDDVKQDCPDDDYDRKRKKKNRRYKSMREICKALVGIEDAARRLFSIEHSEQPRLVRNLMRDVRFGAAISLGLKGNSVVYVPKIPSARDKELSNFDYRDFVDAYDYSFDD